jgi:hypothetical protein
MPEFTLKSGNKLVASCVSFKDGIATRDAVKRCLEAGKLLGLSDADSSQRIVDDIGVREMFFVCAKAATYAGAKVNEALFDDPALKDAARADYDEIVSKVLEVNVNSFFQQASSS